MPCPIPRLLVLSMFLHPRRVAHVRATGRVVLWFHQQTRKGLWAHCRVSEAACCSRGGSSDALAASSKEAWERHLHAPSGGTHGFTSVLYKENICYTYALNSGPTGQLGVTASITPETRFE